MLQLLHTPEGVRDFYGEESARKHTVCGRIRSAFELYGYQEIQTPVFEYFDIFNAERGSVSSREMYKLFDRDGETLVLRPDYTPAIARCAAKYFSAEALPVRLCYLGNTYVNSNGLRGQLKETTQAGGELLGDSSVAAGAEVLATVIDALKSVGLKEFMIEVGDVRYFNGLLAEAGIPEEVRAELRTCIENKNHFGLEEILERNGIDGSLKEALVRLPQMFGSPAQVLAEARTLTQNPASLAAVDDLEELLNRMEAYQAGEYLSLDLGMLGSHNYYTGLIFKGYSYGTGAHIVSGGRYDNLMKQFGKDAPSVGFGVNVDVLMQALARQKLAVPGRPDAVMILYSDSRYAEAVSLAADFRSRKIPVHLLRRESEELDSFAVYAHENRVTQVLLLAAGEEKIREYIPASRADRLLPCPENV